MGGGNRPWGAPIRTILRMPEYLANTCAADCASSHTLPRTNASGRKAKSTLHISRILKDFRSALRSHKRNAPCNRSYMWMGVTPLPSHAYLCELLFPRLP